MIPLLKEIIKLFKIQKAASHGMQIQTLIFDKDHFSSKEEAQNWAKQHNFGKSEVDETEESYRIRQKNPAHYKTMRTIELKPGVKAVVGKQLNAPPKVKKSLPSSSSVHVNKPLGEETGTGFEPKNKKPNDQAREDEFEDTQFPPGIQNNGVSVAKGFTDGEPEKTQEWNNNDCYVEKNDEFHKMFGENADNTMAGLYDMQQIVTGMDYEMAYNTRDEDEAVMNAVKNLMDDPDFYRKRQMELDAQDWPDQRQEGDNNNALVQKDVWPNTGANVEGFSLDLGCGSNRQPGHLGLDLYPYDQGTIIHDLNLGIPFPAETAEKIHMENSLDQMEGISDDPSSLMNEIHRVLRPGGKFTYVGSKKIDPKHIPSGLIQTWDEDHEGSLIQKLTDSPGVRQEFTRVQADPATANDAEPRVGIQPWDMLPADAILAATALDYAWSDATTSSIGNKLHGYPSQGALVQKEGDQDSNSAKIVPIVKADRMKQIVYCIVLEPDFEDEQGDIMTAEEIEKSAHDYLEKSRIIGTVHSGPISATPVESYIAPEDIEIKDGIYGPQTIKKGSWVIGIKVIDPKEWAKVLEGEYQGVSVGGMGLRQKIV